VTIQPEIDSPPWARYGTKGMNGTKGTTAKGAVVAPEIAAPRRAGPATSGRITPDYRLRGLDFETAALIEPPAPPRRKQHASVRRKRRRLLLQWAIALVVVAVVAVLLRVAVVQPYTVDTTAMVPVLQPHTRVLVVTATFLTGSVHQGDVVVLHQPQGAGCAPGDLVSRAIGMPGQTIWSVGQSIYIDGQVLDEPGWYNVPFGEVGTSPIPRTTIPEGNYFVLGDNRTDTCDSRSFGLVASSLVIGEVVATTTRSGHLNVHVI
jgi:signal peptidase I